MFVIAATLNIIRNNTSSVRFMALHSIAWYNISFYDIALLSIISNGISPLGLHCLILK